MIIGRGLLANALKELDDSNYLFYVNGISNSVLDVIPEQNFELAEIDKLVSEIGDRIFVYFSTTQVNSISNHHRPYVSHKFNLENQIKKRFRKYTIVRTSNLVGNNPWNQHTLFNFLHNALFAGEEITVNHDLLRNFLDVQDFITILTHYLQKHRQQNDTIEIVHPTSYNMGEVINSFELFFKKKFIIKRSGLISEWALFELNHQFTSDILLEQHIDFDNYLENLLRRYYTKVVAEVAEG